MSVQNGGTSCPACRAVSSSVQFSRPLQKVVDTLLRYAPDKARTASERMQADAIYHPGLHLRVRRSSFDMPDVVYSSLFA